MNLQQKIKQLETIRNHHGWKRCPHFFIGSGGSGSTSLLWKCIIPKEENNNECFYHPSKWNMIIKAQHCELSITLEVLYSFHPQFQGGIFIAYKNNLWVLLEGRYCPHVIHAFFYGFVQSKCLVHSSDENHDLRNEETWTEGPCDWAETLCWFLLVCQAWAVYCSKMFHLRAEKKQNTAEKHSGLVTFIWRSNLLCIHDSAHSHSQCHSGHLCQIAIKESCISNNGFFCQCLHPCPGNEAWARLIEGNVAIWSNTWQDTRSSLELYL